MSGFLLASSFKITKQMLLLLFRIVIIYHYHLITQIFFFYIYSVIFFIKIRNNSKFFYQNNVLFQINFKNNPDLKKSQYIRLSINFFWDEVVLPGKLAATLKFIIETSIGLTTVFGVVNPISVRVQIVKGDANWFDTRVYYCEFF